jgi:hypothetical protein
MVKASPPATSAVPVAPPAAEALADAGPRNLECRAKDAASEYALFLVWDGNLARGSLDTTAAGRTTSRAVQAELFKGLVLVYPPSSRSPEDRLATVQEEGSKTMQVGDWKAPWLACE